MYPYSGPTPGGAFQGFTLKKAGNTAVHSTLVAYKSYADVYRGDALTEGEGVTFPVS